MSLHLSFVTTETVTDIQIYFSCYIKRFPIKKRSKLLHVIIKVHVCNQCLCVIALTAERGFMLPLKISLQFYFRLFNLKCSESVLFSDQPSGKPKVTYLSVVFSGDAYLQFAHVYLNRILVSTPTHHNFFLSSVWLVFLINIIN